MEDADRNWSLVQTPTGKIINRADAEVLEMDAWVCADPGHYGIYMEPGNCRICGKPRVQRHVAVGFAQKAEA